MTKPLRIYVGYDARDDQALRVCEKSLHKHASIPIDIVPLKVWELRKAGLYYRSHHVNPDGTMWDDRDGKPFGTDFSFTRFCIPKLEDYADDWVLFCDPDMLWRADVAELVAQTDERFGIMCVKHDHRPTEAVKGVGIQSNYSRKNWSSLMLMRPSQCKGLTPYAVNNMSGAWLHGMCWLRDDQIGALHEKWNWLEGWSSPEIDPAVVHHTRGTPDMPGYEDVAFAEEWWKILEEPSR